MRRLFRITRAIAIVLAVILLPLAVVLSHDSPCSSESVPSAGGAMMKAVEHRCYGSPEVLVLADVVKPIPADDQVLVRVHAAAVNPLDWHYLRGKPYILRFDSGIGAPKVSRLGVDFAGTVEAIGSKVTKFKPGDEVFGGRTGAFGEYVAVPQDRAIVIKPANVSFEQAAAVPIAAVTALQALRDKGNIKAGQSVLINGASGGVGTFAVQIAKSFGAEVTAVCSTRNLDMVRKLGADHVVDYTRQDFTEGDQHYDLIVDTVGTHSLLDYTHVLKPAGIYVMVGGPDGKWIGPMATPIAALILSPFVSQNLGMMLAELKQSDLQFLADLLQSGKIIPSIDRTYGLKEVPEAVAYLEKGHARGKVVISLIDDGKP